jgi:hypothetical protein
METQKTISQWAEDTFGPVGTNLSIALRANVERAELLQAVQAEDYEEVRKEIADVVIVLMRLAENTNIDLMAVRNKHFVTTKAPALVLYGANCRMSDLIKYLAISPVLGVGFPNMLAGVVAGLFRAMELVGGDLQEEINRKMAINRQRRWKLDGRGHGQHVA